MKPRILTSIVGVLGAALVWAAPVFAAAPVNTEPPTITGTPRVGETLTAQNGTWTNSPTAFQYQWQRCAAAGLPCTNVAGATKKTYTLVQADAGRSMRVRVTAVNADGAANARSAATEVVQSSGAPANTDEPIISGTPEVGEVLTVDEGSWTGNPTSFAYQWQRCDADNIVACSDVAGANAKTYTLRTGDLGYRLRAQVTAKNANGSAKEFSATTAVIRPVARITNRRPSLAIISVRFVGAQVYARFRICDDSSKNLTILQTDSRPGKLSYTRRFSTLVPPVQCAVYTRHWRPAPRFRGAGRYTVTLRARDKSGLTSASARRTFFR